MNEMSGTETDAKRIYHLTTRADWDEAQAAGMYSRSTRDKSFHDVGFIHGSLPSQLTEVAEFIYDDCDEEFVVLVMDLDRLESAGLGALRGRRQRECYPHMYRPCHADWLTMFVQRPSTSKDASSSRNDAVGPGRRRRA